MLLSQVSPTGPLCQILRKKHFQPWEKGAVAKSKSIQSNLPWGGLSGAQSRLCPGGSGSRARGAFLHAGLQKAVCCAQPGSGWQLAPEHPGALKLPGGTVLLKESDLREDDQPGQQNTCRAGQNSRGGKGRVFPSGG